MKNIKEHVKVRFNSLPSSVRDKKKVWWEATIHVRWQVDMKISYFRQVVVTV